MGLESRIWGLGFMVQDRSQKGKPHMSYRIRNNQTKENMDNERTTESIEGIIGVNISNIVNGHGFLVKEYLRECPKLPKWDPHVHP